MSDPWVAATAIATFLLALATAGLAWQARSEIQLSRAQDRERRGELHILEADPLAVEVHYDVADRDGDPLRARLTVTNAGDRNVSAITATVRADGVEASRSTPWDCLVPGQDHEFELSLEPFVNPQTRSPLTANVEIVIESHGIFGQRVIQTYVMRLGDRLGGTSSGEFAFQRRLEIVPSVPGATSSVVSFSP